ncbi:MAG: M1 family aminopeptidase, partial [Thermodesulfobacteriota bacterium]|nr:M1 family aminopeptidase [Thermodesulfobacteriota bacterium]
MKFILIQPIFFFFLLCYLMLPSLLHAANSLPRQDISIYFDLNNATMMGSSVITLPPNMELQLYLGDLENVQAVMVQDSGQEPIDSNEQKTISLPSSPKQQTISLSWQLTTANRGPGSGNLISKKGITLAGLWHPVADHDMLFSLTASLPQGFNGITEADKLVITGKTNKRLLKASYPHPLQSINFVAGPYTVRSRKAGATTVYTYFFPEDAGLAADYLDKATGYIKRYEKLIGPFPFKRYSIVENRLPTGYGMPTFTLLGQAVIRLPFIKDTSLGHEILHSWFGNALRLDDSGNWCEGLTTFLADQSYAADKGEDIQYRKNQLMRYQSYVHDDNIAALIDFRHGGDSQPMAKKLRAIGYDKSSMIFHMLRQELGDEQFFTALKRLYKDYKYQQIGWTDIETVFSESAGRDLSLFFGQWLLRHDIPALSADNITVEQKNGKSVLAFHLVQHTKDPYRLLVPVIVKTRDGITRDVIKVDSSDQQVFITLDSLPTELLLDPEYDIMRDLQPDELHPTWMQFMGAEKRTVVLPGKEDMERYMPLIADLERRGPTLVTAAELKNSELKKGSFIFLGSSAHTLGLFGRSDHPAKGFTLDVRNNPLNPDHVMVLVTSSSTEETTRVVRKLNHYGKYSYLHFSSGIIREKRVAPSTNGI